MSSSASIFVKLMNIQRNLSCKPRRIIAILSLTLLLMSSLVLFLSKSEVYALPNRAGHSGSSGVMPSGIQPNAGSLNRGPLQAQSGNSLSGARPNGGSTGTLEGLHHGFTNCAGSNAIFPGTSATNCASSNVGRPNSPPNTTVVNPANCNTPTTVRHTNAPSTTVVHPTNCPNTTIVQPTNCNIPTAVRHTNAPSTTAVHPTNCPPASSSGSNSLTINNVQSSSTTTEESSTSAGLFDYLTATDSSQNNIITPVANAGPNQIAYSYAYVGLDGSSSYDPNNNPLTFSWMQIGGDPVQLSSYNAANPVFIAPIEPYPTNLMFQLIVNNGQANSTPSYVNITVEP